MCGSQFAQQLQIKNVPVKPQCGLKQSAADLMFSNVTEMTFLGETALNVT